MSVNMTHVGITVKNLEESIKFYEMLDFTRRVSINFKHEFFGAHPEVYGVEAQAYVEFMQGPNGMNLELFQFDPQSDEAGNMKWDRPCLNHLGLQIDSLPELDAKLRAAGVNYLMPMETRGNGSNWLWITDPSGNLIEIVEPMPPKKD